MPETVTYDKLLKLSQLARFKGKQDEFNEGKFLGKDAQAASAAKLGNTSPVGSSTQPVYFGADGLPVAGAYELNKTVPADAVFTDTTYEAVAANSETPGLMSGEDKARLDGLVSTGGEPNVITGVTVGGDAVTPVEKVVALGSAAAATVESALTDGSNLPTGAAVKSFVEGKGYQTAAEVSSAISSAVATAMDYKGVKPAVADLPDSGNKTGDVWHVTADGSEYAWNGSGWEELGVTFDATGFVQASDITVATDADIDALFEEQGE